MTPRSQLCDILARFPAVLDAFEQLSELEQRQLVSDLSDDFGMSSEDRALLNTARLCGITAEPTE